jgi:hypothetical protein
MGSTPRDASSSKIPSPTPALLCRICGKPVPVETAKGDGDGKAIHEECYLLKVKLEHASQDGHSTRPWKTVAAELSLSKTRRR